MTHYRSDCEEYQPPMRGLEYTIIGVVMLAAVFGLGLLWLYCV